MPSTYTTRNRLEKQAAGENNNTWGQRLNDNVIDLVDQAQDGVVGFTLSGSKTLTVANAASDEARNRVLNITGGTGGTVTIPNLQKMYVVRNASSGNVIFTTGTGTTATVAAGLVATVFCDGSNGVFTGSNADFGAATIQTTGTAKFGSMIRASFGKGYMLVSGSGGGDAGTNPIMLVDGSINDTTLGSAYGVGFSKAGVASFLSGFTTGGGGWGFYVCMNGTARVFLNGETGAVHSTSGFYVNGNLVVGSRRTGWSAPSGAGSRASFDSATVSTSQLAQRVTSLISDLIATGIIGA